MREEEAKQIVELITELIDLRIEAKTADDPHDIYASINADKVAKKLVVELVKS